MQEWAPLDFYSEAVLPNIVAVFLVTLILGVAGVVYYIQNRNAQPTDEPKRFTVMMDTALLFVKQMVVETFGPKYVKATPYFLFLICFLLLSNIFAIFGIKEPTTSYSVVLTLGFITWCSTLFCAIKYQRLTYLKNLCFTIKIKNKKYPVMINPLNLLSEITPLISLTFRLWGNIIAGYIIYAMIFWVLGSLIASAPYVGVVFIGGILIMPFLLFYFSLFTGIIQAYVFVLLSMTYVSKPILTGLEEQLAKQQAN